MTQLPLGPKLGHVLDGVLPRVTRVTLEGHVTRFVRGKSGDPTWGAGALALREQRVEVPFVGHYLPSLRAGMAATLAGVREDHDEYGPQLYVQDVVSASLPLEPEAVAAYLAANIHGLGPARAKTVADVLGRAAIARLIAEPELLATVFPGLRGQALAAAAHIWAARVAEEGASADAEAQLMTAGLGQKLARRVVRFFASPALGAIVAAEAPYRLLAVPGMGWQRTDAVAQRLGVAPDAPVRFVAAAESALRDAMEAGHSCLPRASLAKAIRPLVGGGVTDAAIEAALDRAEESGRIIRSADLLYLPEALESEWHIADAVAALVARPAALTSAQREIVRPIIEERVHVGTADERDALSPAQRDAVWLGLEHGLAILTGRPGAGKTSTVAVYLRACAALGWSVAVAAPTGKAAARAAEVAKVQAGTLHRLIGGPPGHYRDRPLDADVIVVDETSMCSTETLGWLLMNVNTARTRVLLVGDPAQLPSVDHGAVLRDLLGVASIPRVALLQVFRQGAESGIIRNAHALLDGRPVELRRGSGDFRFVPVEAQDDDAAGAVLSELRRVVGALARKHGAATAEQVQVLTPRRTGPLGAVALNTLLQAELNPHGAAGPEIAHEHVVRVGDKVIQRRNDYGACDGGLFNGEQGVVTGADTMADSVTVRFGPAERELTLRGAQLANLELAWAVTVHRSQGSEWRSVVMPYHELHEPMLEHAVLYTGLTRAKQLFALIGSESAVRTSATRTPQAHARVTGLRAQCAASGLAVDATTHQEAA